MKTRKLTGHISRPGNALYLSFIHLTALGHLHPIVAKWKSPNFGLGSIGGLVEIETEAVRNGEGGVHSISHLPTKQDGPILRAERVNARFYLWAWRRKCLIR